MDKVELKVSDKPNSLTDEVVERAKSAYRIDCEETCDERCCEFTRHLRVALIASGLPAENDRLVQRLRALIGEIASQDTLIDDMRERLAAAERDAARWLWWRSNNSDVSYLFNETKWDGGQWARLGSRWVNKIADDIADAAIAASQKDGTA